MIAGADDDDDLLSEVQIADKKLRAALAVEAEVLALRQECAPMVVSDALLSGLSQAGVLAALQALFNGSAPDFLEHPLFRGAAHVDQFPDHSRHALATTLFEQGVLSAAILAWLRPLSMIGTETFDIAQIWGSQPKHELRIVALLSVETTPELGLE